MSAEGKRLARIIVFQILYQRNYIGIDKFAEKLLLDPLDKNYKKFAEAMLEKIADQEEELMELISRFSEKKSHYLKSLRFLILSAVGELSFYPKTPGKVVINETIEICKDYIGLHHANFCNGILHNLWHRHFALISTGKK